MTDHPFGHTTPQCSGLSTSRAPGAAAIRPRGRSEPESVHHALQYDAHDSGPCSTHSWHLSDQRAPGKRVSAMPVGMLFQGSSAEPGPGSAEESLDAHDQLDHPVVTSVEASLVHAPSPVEGPPRDFRRFTSASLEFSSSIPVPDPESAIFSRFRRLARRTTVRIHDTVRKPDRGSQISVWHDG